MTCIRSNPKPWFCSLIQTIHQAGEKDHGQDGKWSLTHFFLICCYIMPVFRSNGGILIRKCDHRTKACFPCLREAELWKLRNVIPSQHSQQFWRVLSKPKERLCANPQFCLIRWILPTPPLIYLYFSGKKHSGLILPLTSRIARFRQTAGTDTIHDLSVQWYSTGYLLIVTVDIAT